MSHESVEKVQNLLEVWQSEQNSVSFDPKPTLSGIAQLIEKEFEQYLKQDPDPFDDRDPGRVDSTNVFGQLLKILFRNEDFMTKLVVSYLTSRDDAELSTLSARLLLDAAPGLDPSVVFQESEDLVPQLFRWAEHADEPLRSYATGLLACAMEVSEIASSFRDMNSVLVPVVLRRLKELQRISEEESGAQPGSGPFANLKSESFPPDSTDRPSLAEVLQDQKASCSTQNTSQGDAEETPALNGVLDGEKLDTAVVANSPKRLSAIRVKRKAEDESSNGDSLPNGDIHEKPTAKKAKLSDVVIVASDKWSCAAQSGANNPSSSSWAELQPFMIGKHCLFPLNTVMQQRLILQYLAPVGEYQDLLSYAFEQNALELILYYIDLTKNKDVRLAFDALKYLASLLVHRKFALELVAHSGVEYVCGVYRGSVASAGVALCLYYLAYNQDVMEKVCLLSAHTLNDLVDYALWLLEHSYESGRCHASMFFTYSFPFRTVLDLFDQKDGMRKLFNYISTLTILRIEEDRDSNYLTDDQLYQSRMAVKNVCVALRSYFVSHLWVKVEQFKRNHSRWNQLHPGVSVPAVPSSMPPYKAIHLEEQSLRDSIWTLLHVLPMHTVWKPVEELRRLGGVTLLLHVVGEGGDWNFASKLVGSDDWDHTCGASTMLGGWGRGVLCR